jgi:hypothetical protein
MFSMAREQFVDNWDTWVALSAFPGYPVMPTIVIQGAATAINGLTGQAFVGRQLVGRVQADFSATPLEEFGGAGVILNPFTAAPTGDFSGQVLVTMAANAPAAGTYRGMVLVDMGTGAGPEPLGWVVVVAR